MYLANKIQGGRRMKMKTIIEYLKDQMFDDDEWLEFLAEVKRWEEE